MYSERSIEIFTTPASVLERMATQLSQEKHSILLIDDEPGNLEMLIMYLEDYQFTVLTALNGREGLETARSELPALILLDISMPRMDGFTVCRKLKEEPLTANIPVIFFSVSDDEAEKVKGFSLGAVDYITKPVRQKELLARVTAHLNQQRLYNNLLQRMNAYQEHFGKLPGETHVGADVSKRHLQQIYRARELLIKDLSIAPSLDELASAVGLSRKKLAKDFQMLYGMPVFEWLREYRLLEARGLLRDTELPIEHIAHAVGYTRSANFATAFKKRFAMTPRDYRDLQSEQI